METSPLSTASTCGIPLPFAEGANRRTSQAATAVAAAAAATTTINPSHAMAVRPAHDQVAKLIGPPQRQAKHRGQ